MKQKLREEKNTKKRASRGRFMNTKKKLRKKQYQKEIPLFGGAFSKFLLRVLEFFLRFMNMKQELKRRKEYQKEDWSWEIYEHEKEIEKKQYQKEIPLFGGGFSKFLLCVLEFFLRFMNMKQKMREEKNTKKRAGRGRFMNTKKKLRENNTKKRYHFLVVLFRNFFFVRWNFF